MTTPSYYIWPGQVHIGFGAVARVGQEARDDAARHVFIVADPNVAAAGLLKPVTDSLAAAGVAFTTYDRVMPNPDIPSVDAASAAYRAAQADMIVALGGGSALDTAKAVRLAVAGPPEASIAEYALRLGSEARSHPRHLPTSLAIPTTAGTGAEVTPWAVITDPKEKFKFGVGGPRSVPSVALIDPDLMLSMPAGLSAATGMDALSHCVEAYVSTNDNPALDPMILYGIGLIARSLPIVVAKGDSRAARHDMAQAAMIGGIAISSKWLGACHSLAHQLSGFANVPHGLANALMLPHQMEYSLPGAIARYAEVGAALGVPPTGSLRQRAEAAIAAVRQLNADLGLPTRLRDVGVTEEMIAPMAHYAFAVDLNWWTNPRSVSEQAMEQMYRAAW
jgi:alcohol dehydrogenase class IV